jgi:hypothetical protein
MRAYVYGGLVLLVGLAYAVVRYIVFGGVGVGQLPLYVANKAVAFAGLALIVTAVGARPLSAWLPGCGWLLNERRSVGMLGFGLSAVHTVMSLMLLNPGYFGKFYDAGTGQMHPAAEVSMLAGVVALALLVVQSRAGEGSRRSSLRWLGVGVLAMSLVHLGFMGWPGWWTSGKWPGGLPPITLLSAVVAGVGLGLGLVPRRG